LENVLAVKIFWLRPSDGARWHTPNEVAARLTKVFDHVSAEREEARILGERFVDRYRALLQAGLGDQSSPPLEVIERQWNGALMLRAWDDSKTTAPIEFIVQTEHKLELRFPPKCPFQTKRRSAEKIASALGYTIEHFDPSE
jgi:hypothetical protein